MRAGDSVKSKEEAAIRRTSEYRVFVNKVRSMSGGLCQHCGAEGENVHHIIPLSQCLELATDVSNGVYLCLLCHSLVHGGKYKWKSKKKL